MGRLIVVILITFLPCISMAQEEVKEMDFTKADSVAALYPSHSLKELYGLVNKLCAPFDNEVEKFRAIYTWVCLNIENDYQLFLKNQNKRKKLIDKPEELAQWNRSFSKKVFETLLEKQQTVCTGYAYLLKEMASYVGIQAEIVDGYGRTTYANIKGKGLPNHSWNAVQLNGKWYLCDATWSSGNIVTDGRTTRFKPFYDPGYFLADPALFVGNHYPLEAKWLLMENPPTLHEFLNRPIIYRGAFSHQLVPNYPNSLSIAVKKGEPIKFYLQSLSKEKIDNMEVQVKQAKLSTISEVEVAKSAEGNYCFDYAFEKKGSFTMHIFYKDVAIATYEVSVSK